MTIAAIVCAVLSVVFYALCYLNVEERVTPQQKPAAERQSFGRMIGSLFRNRALIGIIVAALLLLVANLLTSAMTGYLWLDYFNSTSLQSVAGFAGLAPTLLLLGIAPWLSNRFGKKEVGVAATLLTGVVNIVTYFLNLQNSPAAFIVLFAVAQFALATFNYLIWAFITDVIDYQEVRTNERDDGTIYAIYSWARKVGQALAGGIGGWALGWIGYQAVAKGQPAVDQTASTLHGIYALSTVVPGVLYLLVAASLAFLYPLGRKMVARNVAELEQRHAAAASAL